MRQRKLTNGAPAILLGVVNGDLDFEDIGPIITSRIPTALAILNSALTAYQNKLRGSELKNEKEVVFLLLKNLCALREMYALRQDFYHRSLALGFFVRGFNIDRTFRMTPKTKGG